MSLPLLLEELRRRDISLHLEGDRLRCSAPPGTLAPPLRDRLQAAKGELIAFLLAARASADRPAAVVPLQAAGRQTPVFAVPGHSGDVFCYRALVDQLGNDQPFYGLQPPGLDGHSAPLTRIEALAAYFVEQIGRFYPVGPCIVAGYCAGGSIAYELTRQLIAQGREVRCLVLIGSPYPAWFRWSAQARHRLKALGGRLLVHLGALSDLPWAAWPTYFRHRRQARKDRRAADQGESGALSEGRRQVEAATLAALRHYTPHSFAGRLCLLLPGTDWRHARNPALGWPTDLGRRVDEYCLPDPCDGYEMLLPGHVQPFADYFRRCCAPLPAFSTEPP